jgi:hypothetical protein
VLQIRGANTNSSFQNMAPLDTSPQEKQYGAVNGNRSLPTTKSRPESY